jgi:hydroxylysine kinase
MDLFRFDPPDLADVDVRRIADELYGLSGETRRLRGERSHNTWFTSPDGDHFVLRVASASEPDEAVDCPAQALIHIERSAPQLPVARMRAAHNGQLVPAVEIGGRRHLVRLETFLPGVTFDDGQPLTNVALTAIGDLIGAIAVTLTDFTHDWAVGFMPWDIANGLVFDDELTDALDDGPNATVIRARPRLEAAAEAMKVLPRHIIHNDGHAGNLLRPDASSDVVTGVIDFGDLVHTVSVADVAVAGASLVPHQADPVAALAALTAGYRASRPLNDAELAALPDLVLTRLVLSTLLINYQITHAAHLTALVADELPGTLASLERWLAIDPTEARAALERTA